MESKGWGLVDSLEIQRTIKGNWIQMYTDGAVKAESGLATVGGVMRDRSGKWILGFNRYLGICSVLEAELWTIFDGLALILNLGHDKVLINTDNMETARAI
ncbi:hypothetical protein Golob_012812 [Gossypium lobatum]|uniref:RNase H type-1 domain-containing protein n=1 Tax=Gossypium lobatum TaxID=34289 RepID=A0A7J8LMK7_9ROSI|nr:hypothetical protein [Gossypium lobatum]